MISVPEWLKTIEMKKCVEDGMFLQIKIMLIICQKKNTSTRNNGGTISISPVLTLYHWENVLISSKRCLLWNVYTKKLEKNNSCPLVLGKTNNGSRHRVRPLHGGNGKTPGGLFQIQRVKEEASKSLWKERGDPLLTVFCRKSQTKTSMNSTFFVTDGSFTADVGLL